MVIQYFGADTAFGSFQYHVGLNVDKEESRHMAINASLSTSQSLSFLPEAHHV
ncbi:hypothetical protein PITC_000800 [Penicillium italicum]|uniref:Uncharacterized protein n=1 Tax=Penicillium italicum TaxID=40296 RepID=A0A0A2KIX0_PENIT|nr:hypothetical protein PITC_000800 [Penicillium italicum]